MIEVAYEVHRNTLRDINETRAHVFTDLLDFTVRRSNQRSHLEKRFVFARPHYVARLGHYDDTFRGEKLRVSIV